MAKVLLFAGMGAISAITSPTSKPGRNPTPIASSMRARALSAAAAIAAAGCVAQLAFAPKPLLVWNMTASAPLGLYWRAVGRLQRGDWVLVWPPQQAANLAAQRGYLPHRVPMVKRLQANGGDTICRSGRAISINGETRAIALFRDRKGRKLPTWDGCARLHDDQIFVLTAPPDSFDSRYFGAIPRSHIIERIVPLWTF